MRGSFSGIFFFFCCFQHLLARVTSDLRDELDLARMPPDPPDSLCSFPWRCFLPSTLNTLSHTLCRTSQLPKCMLVARDTHHVSQPTPSTSPSPRLRSARRCRFAPVHLSFLAKVRCPRCSCSSFGSGAFLQDPFPLTARPLSRLSRRMGDGVFFSFVVQENMADVAKRSTLGKEKTTNNGHSQRACASRLNRVNGFRLFNIRKW